mgnify:CR=1 FL=1
MVGRLPKPVIWATVRSTFLSWVVLRAFVGFASGRLSLTLSASVFLMLGVVAIALIDVAVARERLFLGNLGVGRRTVAAISFSTVVALEVAAHLVLSGFLRGTG